MRVGARKRIEITLDVDGRQELASHIEPVDKLKFKDSKRYKERISKAQKSTQEKDALVSMLGTINGLPVAAVFFEFDFMGGSMGSVVGEKFVLAAQAALRQQIPLICFSASGGARMQEALFSLMQMGRTAAILKRLKQAGIPYLSVMTDPVYGGVSASLAMLGDINIAEPNALIGFAGPRVIEQTVRQKLPEGFQRSEFLLDHGVLDMIVHRADMKQTLTELLEMLAYRLPEYETILRERSCANAMSVDQAGLSENTVDNAKNDQRENEQTDITSPAESAHVANSSDVHVAENRDDAEDIVEQKPLGENPSTDDLSPDSSAPGINTQVSDRVDDRETKVSTDNTLGERAGSNENQGPPNTLK